jgi:hypothetical protein
MIGSSETGHTAQTLESSRTAREVAKPAETEIAGRGRPWTICARNQHSFVEWRSRLGSNIERLRERQETIQNDSREMDVDVDVGTDQEDTCTIFGRGGRLTRGLAENGISESACIFEKKHICELVDAVLEKVERGMGKWQ